MLAATVKNIGQWHIMCYINLHKVASWHKTRVHDSFSCLVPCTVRYSYRIFLFFFLFVPCFFFSSNFPLCCFYGGQTRALILSLHKDVRSKCAFIEFRLCIVCVPLAGFSNIRVYKILARLYALRNYSGWETVHAGNSVV